MEQCLPSVRLASRTIRLLHVLQAVTPLSSSILFQYRYNFSICNGVETASKLNEWGRPIDQSVS